GSATRASSPPTCPTRSRSSASASPQSPNAASPGSASGSRSATATDRPRDRVRSLNEPPIEEGLPPIEVRLAAAGLPPLPRTAWIEIDLGALTQNVAVLRELAGPGVEVHPVVKGNAYGHGMQPIARALAAAGVDGICVATFDEALALREGGVSIPV